MPRPSKHSRGASALIPQVSWGSLLMNAMRQVPREELDSEGFTETIAYPLDLGVTVIGAAKALGVSRQRVYQLIQEGSLIAFELVDDFRGSAGVFVRSDSLRARLKAQGKSVPRLIPGEVKELAFTSDEPKGKQRLAFKAPAKGTSKRKRRGT